MVSWTIGKSPNFDGLPYVLYAYMLNWLCDLLASLRCNGQQNGRIPSLVDRGTVELMRKDTKKWDYIDSCRSLTLLCSVQNFGHYVIYEVGSCLWGSGREEQMYTIPKRYIHNLHLMLYLIKKVAKETSEWGFDQLDQSKTVDRIDRLYLAAALEDVINELVFRDWIA